MVTVPYRTPFLDPRTGTVSREWIRFFQDLANSNGSGGSAIDLPLVISDGGTGATSAGQARVNLGAEQVGAAAAAVAALPTAAHTGSYLDLTNKPTIPAAQVNSDWSAVSGLAQILHKPTLATVAASGLYSDLSGKPTIPAAQVQTDWNAVSGMGVLLNKPGLATVATTGLYSDLSGKPTIPAAQVNSDWAAASGLAQILNKPTIPAAQVQTDWNAVSGMGVLLNKPTIPSVPVTSVFGRTGAVLSAINDYSFSQISGTIATGQLPTGIPNANLANSAVTVTAGTGLTGGGSVSLGSSVSLALSGSWADVASPVYSGSGSMTVAINTKTDYQYCTIGPTVFIKGVLAFNLGGTASNVIFVTLPVANVGALCAFCAYISVDGGVTYTPGYAYVAASGVKIQMLRAGSVNYALGTNAAVIFFSGYYRVV